MRAQVKKARGAAAYDLYLEEHPLKAADEPEAREAHGHRRPKLDLKGLVLGCIEAKFCN